MELCPAAFLAVHVYVPECPCVTDVINSILVREPNALVANSRSTETSLPWNVQERLIGVSPLYALQLSDTSSPVRSAPGDGIGRISGGTGMS